MVARPTRPQIFAAKRTAPPRAWSRTSILNRLASLLAGG
jgi:hypothetical protein